MLRITQPSTLVRYSGIIPILQTKELRHKADTVTHVARPWWSVALWSPSPTPCPPAHHTI